MSRRTLFYVAVLGLSTVMHLDIFAAIVSEGGAKFVRRQSEAYAMMLLIPLFWEWFATGGHPASREHPTFRQHTPSGWFTAWFAALIGLSLVLAFDTGIPNQIVTLKEALAAAIVISLYLAWSRSFFPHNKLWAIGASTQNRIARLSYYAVVVLVIVVTYKPLPAQMFGESTAVWLEENSEAFGATVLIPLYFDLVSRQRGRLPQFVWYGVLASVPLLVQVGIQPPILDPLMDWLAQMTEAFIAALGISLYFDVVRPIAKPEPVVVPARRMVNS